MLVVCAALLSALLAHGAPPVQAAGVLAGRLLQRVGALATPQEALLSTSSASLAQLPQGPGTRVGAPAAHAGHMTVLQPVLVALLVPACWRARSAVKPGFQTKPRLPLRKELIVTCLLLLLATPVAGGRRSRAQRRTAALGSGGGTSSALGFQPAGGPPAASPARDCPQNPPCSRRCAPTRAELIFETPRPGLHAESAEARTGGAAGAGPSWSCPCGHKTARAHHSAVAQWLRTLHGAEARHSDVRVTPAIRAADEAVNAACRQATPEQIARAFEGLRLAQSAPRVESRDDVAEACSDEEARSELDASDSDDLDGPWFRSDDWGARPDEWGSD